MQPNDSENNNVHQDEIDTETHSDDVDNDNIIIDLEKYQGLDEEVINENPDIILDTVPAISKKNTIDSSLSMQKKIWLFIIFLCLCISLAVLVWFTNKQRVQKESLDAQKQSEAVTPTLEHINPKEASLATTPTNVQEQNFTNQPVQIKLDKTLLVRPAEGTSNILTESQIGWCLYQKLRIDTLRASVRADKAIISVNNETESYNKRCGSYQYSQGSLSVAQNNLAPHQKKIVTDAKNEAVELDKKAKSLVMTSEISTSNLPLVVEGKESQPSSKQKQLALFPNNECALVIKKTFNFIIAKNFASNKFGNNKLIRIYRMKDGLFAVAIGFIKPNKMHIVDKWKKAGKLPQNTKCLNNTYFVQDVTDAQPNNFGLTRLDANNYSTVKKQAQINSKAEDYGYQTQRVLPDNALNNSSLNQPVQTRRIPPQNQQYQNNNYNGSSYNNNNQNNSNRYSNGGYRDNNYNNNAYSQNSNINNGYSNNYQNNNTEPYGNKVQNSQASRDQPQRTVSRGNGLDTGSFRAGSYEDMNPEKNLKELNNLFNAHGGSIEKNIDSSTNVTTLSSGNIQSTGGVVSVPTTRTNTRKADNTDNLAAIDALANGRSRTQSHNTLSSSDLNESISLADSSTPSVGLNDSESTEIKSNLEESQSDTIITE